MNEKGEELRADTVPVHIELPPWAQFPLVPKAVSTPA
jgi:hypothetical protein